MMIREATHNDIETIARVIVAAWQTAYEGIIYPSFPPSMKEEKFVEIFTDIFENRKEIVFVYEEHNTVLGFVSGVEQCGKYDCEIKGLYVDPEYQGKGIGSSLLNEMVKSGGIERPGFSILNSTRLPPVRCIHQR